MDFYLNPVPEKLRRTLGPLTEIMSRWMSMTDHSRLLGLVSSEFTPRMVAGLAPRIKRSAMT